MKIEDMILVKERKNAKGYNFLCTFSDFVGKVLIIGNHPMHYADMIADVTATRYNKSEWGRFGMDVDWSYQFKYCQSFQELQLFVLGKLGDRYREVCFDERRCSEVCLTTLETLGLSKERTQFNPFSWHYEKLKRSFDIGEILHNFNGGDYRVMEKYSDKFVLLMDVKSGSFLVGADPEFYAKYPASEDIHSENCEHGISWAKASYFGSDISEIDFSRLREIFGERQIKEERCQSKR